MSSSADTLGLSLLLGHALDLASVAALLVVGFALGTAVLRHFGLRLKDPLAAMAFGIATGLTLLSNAFLVLGALGWLWRWSLAGAVLAAGFIGRKELAFLHSLVKEIPHFLRERGGWGLSLAWGAIVFGGACSFLLVLGAAPPVDWDSLMYHLQIPTLFLEEGGIFLPPDNLHVSFVGLLHMLYLPLLAGGRTAAPALLNGALAALLGLTLFSLGGRYLGREGGRPGDAGSLALGMVWGTTTILLVAITPRTDVGLALFLLLAHYAFLLALEEERGLAWAALGALMVGSAAGVKFNGLAYGAGLAPLALWVAWRRGRREEAPSGSLDDGRKEAWGMARTLLVLGGLGLAAMAPWLVKNWTLLGAPVYPYFTSRILEPWIQALYDAAPTAPAPDPTLSQSLRGIRAPVSVWGVFFAPGSLTAEGEGAFYFTNRVLLFLPLGVFFMRRRWVAWIALPPLLYLALILGAFPATNLRYLIPAVPALTLVTAYVLLESASRYLPRRLATVAVLAVATLTLAPSYRTARRWLEDTEALSHFRGSTSAAEYWETHLDPGVRAFSPMVRHINEFVPGNSRILMLFEARGFPLEPRVLQDNKLTNWAYLAGLLPPGGCGEEWGADHLLLASAALRYYQQRGLDPGRLRWDRFQDFAEACLSPVIQVPGYVLFQWEPRSPPPTSDPPSSAASLPDPPGAGGSRR